MISYDLSMYFIASTFIIRSRSRSTKLDRSQLVPNDHFELTKDLQKRIFSRKKSKYFLARRRRKLYDMISDIHGVIKVYDRIYGVKVHRTDIIESLQDQKKCDSSPVHITGQQSSQALDPIPALPQPILTNPELKQLQSEVKSLKLQKSKILTQISKSSNLSPKSKKGLLHQKLMLNKLKRFVNETRNSLN